MILIIPPREKRGCGVNKKYTDSDLCQVASANSGGKIEIKGECSCFKEIIKGCVSMTILQIGMFNGHRGAQKSHDVLICFKYSHANTKLKKKGYS